jgi:hypothetical protein
MPQAVQQALDKALADAETADGAVCSENLTDTQAMVLREYWQTLRTERQEAVLRKLSKERT